VFAKQKASSGHLTTDRSQLNFAKVLEIRVMHFAGDSCSFSCHLHKHSVLRSLLGNSSCCKSGVNIIIAASNTDLLYATYTHTGRSNGSVIGGTRECGCRPGHMSTTCMCRIPCHIVWVARSRFGAGELHPGTVGHGACAIWSYAA
jgi:hypothetical protein